MTSRRGWGVAAPARGGLVTVIVVGGADGAARGVAWGLLPHDTDTATAADTSPLAYPVPITHRVYPPWWLTRSLAFPSGRSTGR